MLKRLINYFQDRAFLKKNGYLMPRELADKEQLELLVTALKNKPKTANTHPHFEDLLHVLNDKALRSTIKTYFGAGYKLWRTQFFRRTRSKPDAVRWHHDKHFQNGDDEINYNEIGNHISIFIALADVTDSNGVLNVINSSHTQIKGIERDQRPYHKRPAEEHFLTIEDSLKQNATPLEFKKGQFMLFHSALIHSSERYRDHEQAKPRLALIGRLAKNECEIPEALADSKDIVPFN